MTAPAAPRRARHITAQSWRDLGPRLRRIVFHSPTLADYPFRCNGAHIKIFLPHADGSAPQLPTFTPHGPAWADPARRPVARTYTLRAFDAAACTLTIDFVLHGDNGPASRFAEQVQAGQVLGISDPAGPVPMLTPASNYLLAGDLTALPALAAMLADMAHTATGDILLWLPDRADLPTGGDALPLPPGVRLHTFFGGLEQAQALVSTAQHCCPSPAVEDFAWFAGEATMVAALRALARQHWQLPRPRCYAVPYWRAGESEEAYHRKRHDFMDN